jgi:nucleoside-diphosphate-sugar epimerase
MNGNLWRNEHFCCRIYSLAAGSVSFCQSYLSARLSLGPTELQTVGSVTMESASDWVGPLTFRRVLITGAGGFLAGPVARELEGAGYHVRLHRRREGDIRDPSTWATSLKGIDAVVHLAAQTSARHAEVDPVADLRTNAEAILYLIRAAASAVERPPIVVLSGTDTQAGQLTGTLNDDVCDRPRTLYDQHKLCAEQHLEWGTRKGFVRGVTLRFSTLFGAGSRETSPDRGVINHMVRRALRGEPLTVYGDGSCLRDFLHVADAATAIRRAVEKIDSVVGDHFVVGSGHSLTVLEAFTRISAVVEEIAGFRAEVKHVPWPSNLMDIDRRSVRLDASRFCGFTGWSPRRTFEEGVAEAVRTFAREER